MKNRISISDNIMVNSLADLLRTSHYVEKRNEDYILNRKKKEGLESYRIKKIESKMMQYLFAQSENNLLKNNGLSYSDVIGLCNNKILDNQKIDQIYKLGWSLALQLFNTLQNNSAKFSESDMQLLFNRIAVWSDKHKQEFSYHNSLDDFKDLSNNSEVQLIRNLCMSGFSNGSFEKIMLSLNLYLSRLDAIYNPKQSIQFAENSLSLFSKAYQKNELTPDIGITSVQMLTYHYMRGNISLDLDKYNHLYFKKGLSLASSNMNIRLSLERLWAENMIIGKCGEEIKKEESGKLVQIANQTKDDQSFDGKYLHCSALAGAGYYHYYRNEIPYAEYFFNNALQAIEAKLGKDWNHQMVGSLCLHLYAINQSNDYYPQKVRKVSKSCDFLNYYQLSASGRDSAQQLAKTIINS